MDAQKKEKVNRFLSDKAMNEAVWGVLLSAFMAKRDGDVNLKAGQMIAIELLHEAWKDLEKYRNETEQEKKELRQIGL